MHFDNLFIAYLVEELSALFEGSFVNKVSEISNGVLKLKLHTKSGSKDLILSEGVFFISDYSIPARHGKSTFAAAVKKELYNKRISSIEQHELDRVVSINFFDHKLVLEMLGEGNKILVGKDGTILACAKNENWSDRTIKKWEKYIFPKSHGFNPTKLEAMQLEKNFSSSQKDSIRSLISAVNISPLIAEEVFFMLGIEKGKAASSLSRGEISKICSKVKEFYTLESSKPFHVAYAEFAYPFELKHLKEKPQQISSLNSYLSEKLSSTVAHHLQEKEKAEKKEKASGFEYMQRQQEEARGKFNLQVEENTKKAELIYSHYDEIEEILKAVKVAVQKGVKEKDIMGKFASAAQSGNKTAARVKKIDLKERKIEIEL